MMPSVTQVLNDAVSTKEDDGKVVLSRRELDKYFSKTVETDKRKEVILDLLDRWSFIIYVEAKSG